MFFFLFFVITANRFSAMFLFCFFYSAYLCFCVCVRPFCSSFVSLTVSIHTYLEHRHVRDLSLLLLFFHQLAPCYLVEFHLLPLLIYIRNIFIAFQENAHIHPRDWTVINLDWRSIFFFFSKIPRNGMKKKEDKELKK